MKCKAFENSITGKKCFIPSGRYGNFLNALSKIVRYVRTNWLKFFICHVTLTVAENVSDLDGKDLNRVITFIRTHLHRLGSDSKYVAVKEWQSRGAIHYHVLFFYSLAYAMPSKVEIAKSWRLGFVKITAPKLRLRLQRLAGYLGKYIGKGYDYAYLGTKKSFSASQTRQIYKLNDFRLAAVITRYGRKVAEGLICTYTKVFQKLSGGYTETCSSCEKFRQGLASTMDCISKRIRGLGCNKMLMSFATDWVYLGEVAEPF
jgi:hypothetical protein